MKIYPVLLILLWVTLAVACAPPSELTIPSTYTFPLSSPSALEHGGTPSPISVQPSVVPFSETAQQSSPQPMFKFTPAGYGAPLPFSTQSLLEQAREDLADRLGVAVEGVELVEVNQTELALQDWQCLTDSFTVELPAVVFGVEIWLRVDGSLYRYVGHGRQVRLCPQAGE
ncbi:MAG: hypothetical protein ACOY16_00800 [Chloroflexota bacterium]